MEGGTQVKEGERKGEKSNLGEKKKKPGPTSSGCCARQNIMSHWRRAATKRLRFSFFRFLDRDFTLTAF